MRPPLTVLELFCGIGGIAALLAGGDPPRAEVIQAIDLDRVALEVYRANFPHSVTVRNLDTVTLDQLPQTDLWTLSPPCQPHTRRGAKRDLDDPRSAALRNLIRLLPEARPRFLFLENVPGFRASRAHRALLAALDGYDVADTLLCPTDLGWPNRRRRFYFVASRDEPLHPLPEPAPPSLRPLAEFIDPTHHDDPDLAVDPALAERYQGALSIVDPRDPTAITACFTSAYGRSPVRSGSYLALDGSSKNGSSKNGSSKNGSPENGSPTNGSPLRRFHPLEILACLGFPSTYRLPEDLPITNGWRLAGNSLSIPAVRRVLSQLPVRT